MVLARPADCPYNSALREQLLQHVNTKAEHSSKLGQGQYPDGKGIGQAGAHSIDPALAGQAGMMSHSPGESGGDDNGLGDGKKSGKRELSTSKRAAQNRAAQVRCMLGS